MVMVATGALAVAHMGALGGLGLDRPLAMAAVAAQVATLATAEMAELATTRAQRWGWQEVAAVRAEAGVVQAAPTTREGAVVLVSMVRAQTGEGAESTLQVAMAQEGQMVALGAAQAVHTLRMAARSASSGALAAHSHQQTQGTSKCGSTKKH